MRRAVAGRRVVVDHHPDHPLHRARARRSRGRRAAAPRRGRARGRRRPGTRRRGRRCGEEAADHRLRRELVAARSARASAPRSRRGSPRPSLRSAWTAPRTRPARAVCRSVAHRRGILPEPPQLGGAQPPRLARAELAEPQRAEADPLQRRRPRCRPPRAIRRTWRLRPSRIVISISRGADPRAPRAGAVGPSSSSTPSRSRRGRRRRRRPAQPRPVGRRHLVARVGEPVGELAVVGEQDQPGRVGVEPADRIEPPLRVDQLDDRRAARPGSRAVEIDPGRLVERSRPRAARGRPARRRPPRRSRLDVARRVGDDLAADRTRPAAISSSAARREATPRVGEVLGEPHAAKLAPRARRAARRPSAGARAARARPRASGRSATGRAAASRPVSPKSRSNSSVVR